MAQSSTLRRTCSISKPRHALAVGPAQGHQAAEQVQAVHGGEQVEEAIGRVGRQEVAGGVSCRHARS